MRGDRDWVDDHARRAVECGYDAFALTVDLDYYGRRERDLAKRFKTTARRRAVGPEFQMRFSWDDVKRLKDRFDIPIIIKGIATAEDTEIACEHGVEVVYVSNHGGRQLDHGRAGSRSCRRSSRRRPAARRSWWTAASCAAQMWSRR